MRDLKIPEGIRERNILLVDNIDEFLQSYRNNRTSYNSPFEILYNLEKKVMFENNPEECILVPYKDWGDIIFRRKSMREEGDLRIVVYEYDTVIS